MNKYILAITASAFLTGCFPLVEHIYQPVAHGGTVLESSCNYDSGPGRWDKMELTKGGVTIHMRAEEDRGGISVGIAIFVEEGKSIRFTQSEATVAYKAATQQVTIEAITSYDRLAGKMAQQEPTSQMVGRNEPIGSKRYQRAGANGKQFATALKFPANRIAQPFTVSLPPLQSDLGPVSFEPIYFEPITIVRVVALCP